MILFIFAGLFAMHNMAMPFKGTSYIAEYNLPWKAKITNWSPDAEKRDAQYRHITYYHQVNFRGNKSAYSFRLFYDSLHSDRAWYMNDHFADFFTTTYTDSVAIDGDMIYRYCVKPLSRKGSDWLFLFKEVNINGKPVLLHLDLAWSNQRMAVITKIFAGIHLRHQ